MVSHCQPELSNAVVGGVDVTESNTYEELKAIILFITAYC